MRVGYGYKKGAVLQVGDIDSATHVSERIRDSKGK